VNIIKLLIMYFSLNFYYILLGPNFFRSTQFSKTLSLFFLFNPREHVVHPFDNRDKIRKLNFVLFGTGFKNSILLVTQLSTRHRGTQGWTR